MPPKMKWTVSRASEIRKQRESQAEKFFNSDAGTNRAEDLVREGLQNSLDARQKDAAQVRVRIRLGKLDALSSQRYTSGLEPHVKQLLPQLPGLKALSGDCHYLAFEDFNTRGLTGREDVGIHYDGDNAFHTFFRAEGKTDKTHGELGSHGIGKIAFMAASQAHMVLGLTHRFDDHKVLLFGMMVLRSHPVGPDHFECDAWYGHGESLILPTSEQNDLDQFHKDFGVDRRDKEAGLSVVVPWLDQDDDSRISADQIIDAIIRGHAFPILDGSLAVEVIDAAGLNITIDRDSFFNVLGTRNPQIRAEFEPMAKLAQWSLSKPECVDVAQPEDNSPKWSEVKIEEKQLNTLRKRFEAGDKLAFRVLLKLRPKKKSEAPTCFHVFLERTTVQGTALPPMTHFQRRKLLISGMTQRNSSVERVD